LCVAIDGLAPFVFEDGSIKSYCLLGFIIAQVNLVAAWSALGPDRYIVRIPWCCFLMAMVWFALLAGIRLSIELNSDGLPDYDQNRRDMIRLGMYLFGAFVLLQIPLWLAGVLFGWKLKVREEDSDGRGTTARPRFNLKHLLSGTFFLCLALGGARWVLPPGKFEWVGLGEYDVIPLVILFLPNLLVVVPCIWGAFLQGRRLVAFLSVWLVASFSACALLNLVVMLLDGASISWFGFFCCCCLIVTQGMTVLGTMFCLRYLGYSLWDPKPTPVI
jgi:hypothetical protein